MSFDVEVLKVLGIEGGYSCTPGDAGGETNFGIDAATARANGYAGPMSDMTKTTAISIYKAQYWDKAGCGLVAPCSDVLADDLFEVGVNIGVQTAGKLLQRAINALYFNTFSKITVDGNVGHGTQSAIAAILNKHGQDGLNVLRGMFLSLVSCRYIEIVENNSVDAQFEYGWQLNRVIGAP